MTRQQKHQGRNDTLLETTGSMKSPIEGIMEAPKKFRQITDRNFHSVGIKSIIPSQRAGIMTVHKSIIPARRAGIMDFIPAEQMFRAVI